MDYQKYQFGLNQSPQSPSQNKMNRKPLGRPVGRPIKLLKEDSGNNLEQDSADYAKRGMNMREFQQVGMQPDRVVYHSLNKVHDSQQWHQQ